MHWHNRDIWKVAVTLVSLLYLFVLMEWIPASSVGAYEGVSGLATPVAATVQATPTVNVTATMTALQEDKLRQETKQLESQTQNQNNWLFSSSTALIAAVATVIVALFGIFQWAITVRQAQNKEMRDREDTRRKEVTAQDKELKDREEERRKEVVAQDKELRDRAEERFRTAVTALGDENESVQINGAVLLRSFLHEEDKEIYGRYYTQIFDLAVAYLRLRTPSPPLESPDKNSQSEKTSDASLPLTTLRRALTVVFREAFPLARGQHKDPQSLDASGIQLDKSYLMNADLGKAWLISASLRDANLFRANLQDAQLSLADLRRADLREANLTDISLPWGELSEVDLNGAILKGADLDEADLSKADLSDVNIEYVLSMKNTNLCGVKGLTQKQLAACKAKGAIIDEAPTRNPRKSTVSTPTSESGINPQAPSTLPAQMNTPPPSTDGSNATSSQPSAEP